MSRDERLKYHDGCKSPWLACTVTSIRKEKVSKRQSRIVLRLVKAPEKGGVGRGDQVYPSGSTMVLLLPNQSTIEKTDPTTYADALLQN